jgi:hypothetical protein
LAKSTSQELTRAQAVNPTSLSLLERLKATRPDASDWNRLHEVYLPLIQRFSRQVRRGAGLSSSETVA